MKKVKYFNVKITITVVDQNRFIGSKPFFCQKYIFSLGKFCPQSLMIKGKFLLWDRKCRCDQKKMRPRLLPLALAGLCALGSALRTSTFPTMAAKVHSVFLKGTYGWSESWDSPSSSSLPSRETGRLGSRNEIVWAQILLGASLPRKVPASLGRRHLPGCIDGVFHLRPRVLIFVWVSLLVRFHIG